MKYTYEELNSAIHTIIPQFKDVVENGITGNQPMMLKAVAEKHFIDSAWEDNRDYGLSIAYGVCQQAMIDLSVLGYFNFEKGVK